MGQHPGLVHRPFEHGDDSSGGYIQTLYSKRLLIKSTSPLLNLLKNFYINKPQNKIPFQRMRTLTTPYCDRHAALANGTTTTTTPTPTSNSANKIQLKCDVKQGVDV